MARYTGPKNKLARKVGEDLGLKTNALKVARRLMIRPGQHGHRGRRKVSDYGLQLQEKQKVKYIYGILEKQLSRLYKEASKNPTATGSALLGLLERRLDNVVYRAGWAPTRFSARQLVSHGHVQVNGKKMSIPSYRVKVEDVVNLKDKAMKIPYVSDLLKDESVTTPEWIKRKGAAAKIASLPVRDDVIERIDEQLVVEYYSR
ncbi:MAG: 30S ribosomal protein S4 [Candidatus Pacebacteria bacterium]|jgi:small subunit ribosomal protein S4|nr:30S ribosomal protein S4 [Candidatus Paceibacterota bacterium]MBT3511509.1 30S ribosomal protein S4 [Candidatus Paceibacterota bacterium]MBT4005021.1 30S ribosomal protein S4 [Candidatus Paceibacterota bacterium]MBT4358797.1 30S ribosomal protein S4 [Candidatus Paceibacterota bacterium]MBT4680605.1 30S ribosomal protein S4 [Candidatus Paceibacterota bacterium]